MHALRRRRISTFIITAQKPPTSIHSAARVVGASREKDRANGRRMIILCRRS
jgi:hypothetical protein